VSTSFDIFDFACFTSRVRLRCRVSGVSAYETDLAD
jgi:hypothetical protein